ncbi:flippase-like domain-containing protein [Litoricolaceae bacterium]|nr:flippase-like domain-containing protein [Litorivicinaceae bacterium]
MNMVIKIATLPILMIALFYSQLIDLQELKLILSDLNKIIIPIGLMTCVLALTVMRWWLICKTKMIPPNPIVLARIVCISNVAALLLPGGAFTGDLVKAAAIYFTEAQRKMAIFSAIIFDRGVSLATLFVTVLPFYLVVLNSENVNFETATHLLAIVFVAVISIGILFTKIPSVIAKKRHNWLIILQAIIKSILNEKQSARLLTRMYQACKIALHGKQDLIDYFRNAHLILVNALISLAAFLVHAIALLLLFEATEISSSESILIIFAAMASWCVGALIMTPGGIIGGELAFVFLLTITDVGPDLLRQATNLFFAHRILFLIASIIPLPFLMFWNGRYKN